MSVPSSLRRRAPLVLTALVAVAIAVPATAFGIHQFTDVPNDNPFHADIDALADSGVTTGCGTGIYCPKDFVTREQMAAFMNRLGALSSSKTPVVNADRLDGIDSTGFLRWSNITTYHGGPWVERGPVAGATALSHLGSVTRVTRASAGEEVVLLHLPSLRSVGDGQYAFLSATVCTTTANQANAIIDAISIFKANGDPANSTVVSDGTNRTLGSCHTVTDATPDAVSDPLYVSLDLEFFEAAYVDVTEVRVVWTPVG